MESLTTARRIGGSLVVTIPKEIVEEESIKEGEIIKLKVEKIRKNGFGLLRGMRSFSRKDKLMGQLEK